MKKEYVTPELETIEFLLEDIITHSNGTGNHGSAGGGVIDPDEDWWD